MNPLLSTITAVYNRKDTVEDCIRSVLNQTFTDFEHIIIDGGSSDGSWDIIKATQHRQLIANTERDQGIYDALNKGTARATGDYLGVLHADDLFFDKHTLAKFAEVAKRDSPDIIFGNLVYVDYRDTNKVSRRWKAGHYRKRAFRFGWMPPHPTVFFRSEYLRSVGPYRTDLRISGDYELLIRAMYLRDPKVAYIDQDLVRMRVGGVSNASISNRLQANREDRLAWSLNGLKPPHLLRLTKPLRKIGQFLPFWA
jgi:glycosyltransferase involved in cell wall biosynthesis